MSREQFKTWSQIKYRNAEVYTQRDFDIGLEAWQAAISTAESSIAQARNEALAVPRATLELIYAAMNHMGDVLNNMDVVEAEDEEATDAAFDALRELLGKE